MKKIMNEEKGIPVSFSQGGVDRYRENTYVQNILLKALSQGITDPKELKKISGLGRVADVYRSLDKLSIRKEYHQALVDNKVDLGFIVKGLKSLSQRSDSDVVKLNSFQTFLKSLGLDKYEKQEDSGKGWEEAIIEASEKGDDKEDIIEGEYEVNIPETPDSESDRQNRENKIGKDLYAKD
jgi:hypothetical protein